MFHYNNLYFYQDTLSIYFASFSLRSTITAYVWNKVAHTDVVLDNLMKKQLDQLQQLKVL